MKVLSVCVLQWLFRVLLNTRDFESCWSVLGYETECWWKRALLTVAALAGSCPSVMSSRSPWGLTRRKRRRECRCAPSLCSASSAPSLPFSTCGENCLSCSWLNIQVFHMNERRCRRLMGTAFTETTLDSQKTPDAWGGMCVYACVCRACLCVSVCVCVWQAISRKTCQTYEQGSTF